MAQNGSGECPSLLGFNLAKSIVARCRILLLEALTFQNGFAIVGTMVV